MLNADSAQPRVEYDRKPAVSICADSLAGLERCRAAVLAAGGRIGGTASIADADALLDARIMPGPVLVDASADDLAPLDRLLGRLDAAAAEQGQRCVVHVASTLIDLAASRLSHRETSMLCDAGMIELTGEVGVLLADRQVPLVRERDDGAPLRLQQLSEEVGRIARTLAELSHAPPSPPVGSGQHAVAQAPAPSAAAIRRMIRARRIRDQYFDPDLFADPAWDMLLDLLLARIEGRPVAVSSLCIAAAVPPTTALRWIKRMTDEGLFVRIADPRDGRRVFIALSDEIAATMAACLGAIERTGGAAI